MMTIQSNSSNLVKLTPVYFSLQPWQMKKKLGDSVEEGVEYWSENDEHTSADGGKEENENKGEKSAITDSQNKNGNIL